MSVGTNVAKYRKAKGFTQQELADLVDITQEAIARLEKDVRVPSFKVMAKIADALNCSIDDLRGQTSLGGEQV